jgi:hypothetical protein
MRERDAQTLPVIPNQTRLSVMEVAAGAESDASASEPLI